MVRRLLGVLFLLCLLLFAAAFWLGRGKVLDRRHQPFGMMPLEHLSTDFPAYVESTRRLMRDARLALGREVPDEEVEQAGPFYLLPEAHCEAGEHSPYRRGIVLTHGLFASQYGMRELGEFFQSQCFYVLGLLLPEHGTRPGDLLLSSWQRWVEAQHQATDYLRTQVDEVYLSGHSAGGTLALHEAAAEGDVAGLILFAPALEIAPAARVGKLVAGLRFLVPGAAWSLMEDGPNPYRYEAFPLNAAYDTWRLVQETRQLLEAHPLVAPVFMVASLEDTTVGVEPILALMADNPHPASRSVLYSQNGNLDIPRATVVHSRLEEQGILSLSHLGLMTPPDNPFYGKDGSYRYCAQYFPAFLESLEGCLNGQRDFLGEITADNLARGTIQRIAYNPFYEDMLASLSAFLSDLSPSSPESSPSAGVRPAR